MKKLFILGAILLIATQSGYGQHSICGYAVSLKNATPIPNVTVYLNDKHNLTLKEPLRVKADSAGFYNIDDIPSGTYIINAWTAYQAMDEKYAQIIQSDRIELDSNMTIDFVFSEKAVQYSLHHKSHPMEMFTSSDQRTSDDVAEQAVDTQLYINSERVNVGSSLIQKIND